MSETAAPQSDHPVAPVFSVTAFALVLGGVFGAALAGPLLHLALIGRLGLAAGQATWLSSLVAGLLAAAFGAGAAVLARRLAFYEVTAAMLLWLALVVVRVVVLPWLRHVPLEADALESQGTLVVALGLVGAGLLAATAVFVGSTLAYLVAGSGRLDLSASFEFFVARSHLKLSPRTLLALFALVVTGILPGLLVLFVRSLLQDARERRAERRGLLHARRRMAGTLLMTLISVGGVAIGVWALTVVLSVMNGFEGDLAWLGAPEKIPQPAARDASAPAPAAPKGAAEGPDARVLPGLLVLFVRSLLEDARERRAERRGLLYARRRMAGTLLMTLISVVGVAIGVWALTVVLSVMNGFEGDLKAKILGHNAHGMVMKYGKDEFTEWRSTSDRVRGVRGVTGATPFLYNEVMISAGEGLTGAVVKGIDPATIGTVTDLPRSIEEGDLAWLATPARIPGPKLRELDARPPGGPPASRPRRAPAPPGCWRARPAPAACPPPRRRAGR